MKLNKVWASALALLSLTACNKDVEPSATFIEHPKTQVVQVNLTANQETNGLRAVFGLKDDDSGATTGLLMSDKDVVMRVAVRKGNGLPVVNDLTFKKTQGRNHATYSGPITIPNDETSGEYSIAAVLMREVDGGDEFFTEAETGRPLKTLVLPGSNKVVTMATDDNTVKVNVPYMSNWQPASVVGGVLTPVALQMKPFGTLLRMRIKNESEQEQVFRRIRFLTTAFTATPGTVLLEQEYDNMPQYLHKNGQGYIFSIEGGLTVPAKKYSKWMYIWVAPRTYTTQGLQTRAYLHHTEGEDAPSYLAFETTQPLSPGSVPMTLVYGKHTSSFSGLDETGDQWGSPITSFRAPLDYLSLHPLNKDKNGFVNDFLTSNDQVGRFTFDEIKHFRTPQPLADGSYSLPTRGELNAIFPPRMNINGVYDIADGIPYYNIVEENVSVEGVEHTFTADYLRVQSEGVVYAIRLKSKSNRYRTAYRYKSYKESGSKGLIIESTPIGTEDISLDDIQGDSFWNSRSNKTSRKLPGYGSTPDPNGVPDVNSSFRFWTRTELDDFTTYIVFGSTWSARTQVTTGGKHAYYTAYLVKRD